MPARSKKPKTPPTTKPKSKTTHKAKPPEPVPHAEPKLSVPLHVYLAEAVELAAFFDRHWQSVVDGRTGAVTRRGFDVVADRVPKLAGEKIRALEGEVLRAQAAVLATTPRASAKVPTRSEALLARGRFVRRELLATMRWVLGDDVRDEGARNLASFEHAHRHEGEAMDVLALQLDDFASLARRHRKRLADVGGFDARLIDEAPSLADEIRLIPPMPTLSEPQKAAYGGRNAVLAKLQAWVDLVREAARFVFRDQPALARQAGSRHERRQRRRQEPDASVDPSEGSPPRMQSVVSPNPHAGSKNP